MGKQIPAENVVLKRVYEPPGSDDGTRVLVDRLWPRGVSKVDASVDLWLKNLAPSTESRKWFAHNPARWADFQARYAEEVRQQPELYAKLSDMACKGRVTLVYSAHDELYNNAVALRNLLLGRGKDG
jgi:uncharacterized protein YeaO (DUF488 family)